MVQEVLEQVRDENLGLNLDGGQILHVVRLVFRCGEGGTREVRIEEVKMNFGKDHGKLRLRVEILENK